MAQESCAYASGATRLLYVIATDCAVRLALRAGLRLAPSLSTTLLYRAKAAARNVIHFVRAAAAWVDERGEDGDGVVFDPVFFQPAFEAYATVAYRPLPTNQVPSATRIWCVFKQRYEPARQRLQQLERLGYRETDHRTFRLVEVFALERLPGR